MSASLKSGALACLTAAALLSSCSPAPPSGLADTAGSTRLRAPDVEYEPTPQRVVTSMLQMAEVGPGDIVYDLGSGDGRIPITAARVFGARGVGIDIDPVRIAEARGNATAAGVTDRVTFRNEDLLQADFSEATVVTLFLSPELNRKLKPILLSRLKPGTRVVSYWHAMPDWRPEKSERMSRGTVYLWKIPGS